MAFTHAVDISGGSGMTLGVLSADIHDPAAAGASGVVHLTFCNIHATIDQDVILDAGNGGSTTIRVPANGGSVTVQLAATGVISASTTTANQITVWGHVRRA